MNRPDCLKDMASSCQPGGGSLRRECPPQCPWVESAKYATWAREALKGAREITHPGESPFERDHKVREQLGGVLGDPRRYEARCVHP